MDPIKKIVKKIKIMALRNRDLLGTSLFKGIGIRRRFGNHKITKAPTKKVPLALC